MRLVARPQRRHPKHVGTEQRRRRGLPLAVTALFITAVSLPIVVTATPASATGGCTLTRYDDFTRGTYGALTGSTSTSGHTWTDYSGTWTTASTSSGIAYFSSGSGRGFTGFDVGSSTTQHVAVTLESGGGGQNLGPILGATTNSGYMAGNGALYKITSISSGTSTIVANFSRNYTAGDVVDMTLSGGNTINVYFNGTLEATYTDPSPLGGTKIGMYQRFTGTSNGAFRDFGYGGYCDDVAILDGRSHAIECNGNVFQDTDGGWWVHLYARDRDAISSNGATRQKAWTGSWQSAGAGGLIAQPLEADTDNGVTVALPALNSMPSWGWAATFHERVQFPSGHAGTAPTNQADPEDGLWANDAGGKPWHWLSVRNVNVAVVGGGTSVSIASPAAAVPYWTVAGPFLGSFNGTSWLLNHFSSSTDTVSLGPAAKAWAAKGIRYMNSAGTQVGSGQTYKEYEVVCTVLVKPDESDPQAGGAGEQPTQSVAPSDSPSGTQTSTSGESGAGCDAGILGRIPFVGQAFNGLYCGIIKGIGGLADLVRNLFWPSFDFNTKFTNLRTTLDGSILTGPFTWATSTISSTFSAFETAATGSPNCSTGSGTVTLDDDHSAAMPSPFLQCGSGDAIAPAETAALWASRLFLIATLVTGLIKIAAWTMGGGE